MTDNNIIKALSICDFNEYGKNCANCPYRDKRWNGAWENDETDCRYKMTKDASKRLKALSEKENKDKRKSVKLKEKYTWNGKIDNIC